MRLSRVAALFGLLSDPDPATLPRMEPTPPHRSPVTHPEILPPGAGSTTAAVPPLSRAPGGDAGLIALHAIVSSFGKRAARQALHAVRRAGQTLVGASTSTAFPWNDSYHAAVSVL